MMITRPQKYNQNMIDSKDNNDEANNNDNIVKVKAQRKENEATITRSTTNMICSSNSRNHAY